MESDIIFAGDFNCVLSHTDATGHRNNSRALENLVTGFVLSDVAEMTSARRMFTHYTPTGALRLERIYISPTLRWKKLWVDTLVAAFTDHLAIVLRIESSDPILICGRGLWRMNTTILDEVGFRQLLQVKWDYWRTHKKYYPTIVMWWERHVKRMLRQTFTWEGTMRRRDRRTMENFYYELINNALQTPSDHATKATKLKQMKAKITRLHHEEQKRLFLNNAE